LDTYKTISAPSDEILYKEKNSRFFGYVYPVCSEDEVKPLIEQLRKKHVGAVHFCYAWQTGAETIRYRANDDGEPSNTAGMPIYGQIQSFRITNVMVVVVRFFGGVKLGVGGLISAYRTAAKMALEASEIIEKTIDIDFILSFGYKDMNKVMRIIKEKKLRIVSQELKIHCEITVSARKRDADVALEAFSSVQGVKIIMRGS
jgi:uncharacterized YigZ family protein